MRPLTSITVWVELIRFDRITRDGTVGGAHVRAGSAISPSAACGRGSRHGLLDAGLHTVEKPLVCYRLVGSGLLEDIENRAVGTGRDPRAGDVDAVAGHRPGDAREQPRIIDGQRQFGDILVFDLPKSARSGTSTERKVRPSTA